MRLNRHDDDDEKQELDHYDDDNVDDVKTPASYAVAAMQQQSHYRDRCALRYRSYPMPSARSYVRTAVVSVVVNRTPSARLPKSISPPTSHRGQSRGRFLRTVTDGQHTRGPDKHINNNNITLRTPTPTPTPTQTQILIQRVPLNTATLCVTNRQDRIC